MKTHPIKEAAKLYKKGWQAWFSTGNTYYVTKKDRARDIPEQVYKLLKSMKNASNNQSS